MNFILQFLRSHANVHKRGQKPNVLLFSMPRSGSTWVQELIWTQPGFKYVNEPLNLKGSWMQRKSGIAGFEELYSEAGREKTVSYFKGFVDGRLHFLDPSPLRKYYRPLTNRVVFKVIHGGELFINDIARAIDAKIVYLLRHPIAVALSRKQLPRIDQLSSDFVLNHFTDNQRTYARELFKTGNPLEQRVLAWCVQNQLALTQRAPDWLVFTYEQLVVYPAAVIEKLVAHAELPDKDRIYKQLKIPSAVSVQSNAETVASMRKENDRQLLVNGWQKKVTEIQSEKLMEICRRMNFVVYDGDGMPKTEWKI